MKKIQNWFRERFSRDSLSIEADAVRAALRQSNASNIAAARDESDHDPTIPSLRILDEVEAEKQVQQGFDPYDSPGDGDKLKDQ